MAIQGFPIGLLALVVTNLLAPTSFVVSASFDRRSFPSCFIFGTALSSYQYEGAVSEDGKGPSIWDNFTHQTPARIVGDATGDVAVDFYHRYKEDVEIMKNMGLDALRFSISWSRVLPGGKISAGVNKKGIEFYNNIIDLLLSKGIQPFVTMFHWDLPQTLEDEYGGFLSPKIVNDFVAYAELLFKEFGDRVKHWITINEPWSFSTAGYDMGILAPGRCSKFQNAACAPGNSSTEPYLVGHHLLLSHAEAVRLYKQRYQAFQNGVIGITLISYWFVPQSTSTADHDATKRAIDFMFGWYMDPLTSGEYPVNMRRLIGKRLPKFTEEQSYMVQGSYDFVGINYYSAYYAANIPSGNLVNVSYSTDSLVNLTSDRNGVLIGPTDGSVWIHSYPRGFQDLLLYTKKTYNNPVIYITENGIDQFDTGFPNEVLLNDTARVNYFDGHFRFLRKAIKKGVNVKGYFAWSLLDNFEWAAGYTMRYGINLVDFKEGLKRLPKKSAKWFTNFLGKKRDCQPIV